MLEIDSILNINLRSAVRTVLFFDYKDKCRGGKRDND